MPEDPNEPGSGPGQFDSPLDELFVEGAQYHEPSAAERAEWAKAAHAASKRRKRRDRRNRWQSKRRVITSRAVPWLVLAVIVGIVYVVWTDGGGGGGGPDFVRPEQVRVVYATPSDADADAALVDAIRNEIDVANEWFDEQVGRTPKWVEDADLVAVEQRSLARPASELANRADAAGLVADEFRDTDGALPDDEVILVFVPVQFESQVRCGESGVTVVVVWVGSCGDVPSTDTAALDDGISGTIAHELLHSMLAVPTCAPNYGNNGHVIDDPNDIMYDPGDSGEPPATSGLLLDPGRDDYYDHGRNDCPDVKDHPLWE